MLDYRRQDLTMAAQWSAIYRVVIVAAVAVSGRLIF